MCSKILPKDLVGMWQNTKCFFAGPSLSVYAVCTQTKVFTMGNRLHMYEYTLDFHRPAARRRLLRPLSRVIYYHRVPQP